METKFDKLIVCLRGKANCGKSSTIKQLYKLLKPESLNETWDIPESKPDKLSRDRLHVKINALINGIKKCIGIDGFADFVEDKITKRGKEIGLRVRLDFFIECEIIFCTSRLETDNEVKTAELVKAFANKHGYGLIWTAPYSDKSSSKDNTNKKKAEHLKALLCAYVEAKKNGSNNLADFLSGFVNDMKNKDKSFVDDFTL